MLATARAETFQELSTAAPDPRVVDVFRLKYDYHNAKVLVKAEAMGIDAGRLLLDGGRVPASGLAENYQKEQLGGLSLRFQSAIREARRPCCLPRSSAGRPGSGPGLLRGDGPAGPGDRERLPPGVCPPCGGCGQPEGRRPGGPDGEGERVFIPGAAARRECVPADPGRSQGRGAERPVPERGAGPGRGAGGQGGRPAGGSLTACERECDNALTRYLGDARRVPFGVETVIAYLYAKEAELTAIRTILAGRRAGLDGAVIRERLRETYV